MSNVRSATVPLSLKFFSSSCRRRRNPAISIPRYLFLFNLIFRLPFSFHSFPPGSIPGGSVPDSGLTPPGEVGCRLEAEVRGPRASGCRGAAGLVNRQASGSPAQVEGDTAPRKLHRAGRSCSGRGRRAGDPQRRIPRSHENRPDEKTGTPSPRSGCG
jgi:hypothetical protein